MLHWGKNNKKFFQKRLDFLRLMWYHNPCIRVWRSLVARLTGGQEAAGSSPVTRTIKDSCSFERLSFLFCLAQDLNLRTLLINQWPQVAQAHKVSRPGYRFKSCHSDHIETQVLIQYLRFFLLFRSSCAARLCGLLALLQSVIVALLDIHRGQKYRFSADF